MIGWSLAEHMRTSLVADALETAVATRGGHVDGVIFHSDRGCQYTSAEFGELCDRLGVDPVDGRHRGVLGQRRGRERSSGSLKRELAHRQRWATRAEARRAVIRWIEGWFNSRRLHSSLNYSTPIETETNWYRRQDGIAA